MSMKNYSEISNKYMKENKKRTILTIVGIILATVLICAVGTLLLSFKDSMLASDRAKGDFEFILENINPDEVDKVTNNAEVKDSSIYQKAEKGEEEQILNSTRVASLSKGNKNYFDKVYTQKVLEGRKPAADGEVIIDANTKDLLKTEVGDNITLVDKNGKQNKVTIVGVSEASNFATNSALNFETYFDGENLDSQNNYWVFLNLKSEKNKQSIINKVIADANISGDKFVKQDNTEILYLTGNGGQEGVTTALRNMALFVIVIIVVCTVTVIYNTFNISVIERIKYFGILKAIGATPKQIRRIILKEGALMGLIAIPIGCLIGFFALKFAVKIFIGNSLLMIDNFSINFHPSIMIITIAVVAFTILISVLGPARKAKKVSAVEAMRNTNEIKIGKLKRRKAGIIQKIFGIEGSLAYKNIRRTPARFVITLIALTISLILFNVFYGFLDFAKQSVYQLYGNSPFDSSLTNMDENTTFTDSQIKQIEGNSFIKNTYEYNISHIDTTVPLDNINNDYTDKTSKKIGNDKLDDLGYKVPANQFYVGGDKELSIIKDYIVDGKYDYQQLQDGGVILIDGTAVTDKNGKKEIARVTNYKIGDKIKIPKVSGDKYGKLTSDDIRKAIKDNQFIELPIVAISNKDPFSGQFVSNGIEIMMSKETYSKNIKEFAPNNLAFKFDGDKEARADAIKYFDDLSSKGYQYSDVGTIMNRVNQVYGQVQFFIYCFICIVTVISALNIFNTISTNLLIRKKDFSTLKAIGMEEKQLRKSVILEGTFYGIIASIIGGVASVILLNILIKAGGGIVDVEYHFGYIAFIISIIVTIGVTYIATLVPLKRLKNLTIVEGISDSE